jgi:hypothetical protein
MKVIDTLNFGSFPGKIMFTCGYSFKDVCKELKKQKCNEWLECFKQLEYLFEPSCAGFAAVRKLNEFTYHFVCLRDEFDFSDKHHATLSHEVIHIITYNISDMLDIVKENEAFAYTHTHILNQCYEVLRRKPTKFI